MLIYYFLHPLIWFLSSPTCKHAKSLFLTCRALAEVPEAGRAPGPPAVKCRVPLRRCFPSFKEKEVCTWELACLKPASNNQITPRQVINDGSFPKAGRHYHILEPPSYSCPLITFSAEDVGNLCGISSFFQ